MVQKILVTGPNGFVGKHIMAAMPDAIPVPNLRGDEAGVAARVRDADIIIHTAAISNMGKCEEDQDASYRANVLLPLWIAKAADHAKLVFFSTDQVYNGCVKDGPYTEETTNPVNVYARHKLEMEQRVLALRPDAVMLRATWMFDWERGFVANLWHAWGTVTAPMQYRGLTYVREVAENMRKAMFLPGGAYNFGSENPLTMRQITEYTLACLGREHPVVDGEKRHNLWMNTTKAQAYGIRFRSSADGIRACICESEDE